MSSVTRNLIPNESVVLVSRKHWIAPVRDSLLAAGLVLAGLVIWAITPSGDGIISILSGLLGLARWTLLISGIGWIAYNVSVWRTAEFAVTTLRVLRYEGLVRRRASETLLTAVTDVRLDVGFVGARLGYGGVRVFTRSGTPGGDAFTSITQPATFRNAMLGARGGDRAAPGVVPWPRQPVPAGPSPAARASGYATPTAPTAPAAAGAPAPAPFPPTTGAAISGAPARRTGGEDDADRLLRLADLRDKGVITPEEFAAKKAEILARM